MTRTKLLPARGALAAWILSGALGLAACDGGGGAAADDDGEDGDDDGDGDGDGDPELGDRFPAGCAAGADAARDGWRLAWCDEFDGEAIDEAAWGFDLADGGFLASGPGWGNQELEFYTRRRANADVLDGALNITALRDGPHHANGPAYSSTYDYSSARLTTRGKVDFTFGRVEARARIPSGQGVWPAFWMLPSDELYGGWAASGEIDILEVKGQTPGVLYGTLHFGDMWPKNSLVTCTVEPGVDLSLDFHTYAIEWRPDRIQWFVDDVLYATQAPRGSPAAELCVDAAGQPVAPLVNENVTDPAAGWSSSTGDAPAPFDQRFHIILNLAVGGGFVGAPDPGVFPRTYVVDYVRVYKEE